jgi:hypothetical protein
MRLRNYLTVSFVWAGLALVAPHAWQSAILVAGTAVFAALALQTRTRARAYV